MLNTNSVTQDNALCPKDDNISLKTEASKLAQILE